MTRHQIITKINGLFGKTSVIALLLGVLSIASFAQSGNLYEQNSTYRLGYITVYPGSVFRIDMGNSQEIKIYQSCKAVTANGVKGVQCPFTQFQNGRVVYSGDSYVFQNGYVYLKWMYDFTAGYQRNINGGWRLYQVR